MQTQASPNICQKANFTISPQPNSARKSEYVTCVIYLINVCFEEESSKGVASAVNLGI